MTITAIHPGRRNDRVAARPTGNSGRIYSVAPGRGGAFPVGLVVTRDGGGILGSLGGAFRPADARALGLDLIEAAAIADVAHSSHPARDRYPIAGGREYAVMVLAADSASSALINRRRVRLAAFAIDTGDPLKTVGDTFTPADARGLGLALIEAAAEAERG